MTRARQFLLLAVREGGDLLRHRYALTLFAAAAVLVPLGVWGGAVDLSARILDGEARSMARDAIRQANPRHPGTASTEALQVLRAQAPGAVIVRGLNAGAPAYWDTTPVGVVNGYERPGTPELYVAAQELDLELLLRWLLGLALVLLGAESLARARFTGLLKTLATYPVSPRLVVAAKIAGGAAGGAILALALAASAGVSALAFLAPEARGEAIAAALLTGVAGALYLAALFAAGAAVGTVARNPHTATVSALTVWLVAAVVGVPALGLAARATSGAQARTVFEAERGAHYERLAAGVQLELGAILREWVGPDGDTRNVPFEGELRSRIETHWIDRIARVRAEIDALEEAHARNVERQRQTARWLRLLSPGALLLDASSALAGTGTREADRRSAAVETYQDQLQAVLFDQNRPRVNLRIPQRVSESLGYFDRRPGPMVSEIPWFDPAPSSARQRLADAAVSLAALTLYFIVLLAVTVAAFRYRRDGPSDRDWN